MYLVALRAMLLFVFLVLYARPVLALYGAEFADRGVVPLWILVAGQSVYILCGPVGALLYMSGHERALMKTIITQSVV